MFRCSSNDKEDLNNPGSVRSTKQASHTQPPKKKVKRFTSFNKDWLEDKDFAKWLVKENDLTAKCVICPVTFTIKFEGRKAIIDHQKSQKHVMSEMQRRQNQTMTTFLVPKHTSEEDAVIRAEVASVYHSVKHGQSYNSLDCQMKLNHSLFSDSKIAAKISCGRTKATSICQNVLGPFSQDVVREELNKAFYFSVSSDSSNRGNIKTFPYAVQYFDVEHGIRQRLLDFYEDSKETHEAIFCAVKNITEANGFHLNQISAYSADNAPVNYGKNNSVFVLLKKENSSILKANCNCHVINNAIKHGLKQFPYDIEALVLKIYSEFGSSASNVESLKEFADFVDVQFKEILRHVRTRWLSLFPAIERIVHCWPAIKSYFLSKGEEDCSKLIWKFVAPNGEDDAQTDHSLPECYLRFLQYILPLFETAVRKLEDSSIACVQLDSILRDLKNKLENRNKDKFFGMKVHEILDKLTKDERLSFEREAESFLQRCINYLSKNYDFSENNVFHLLSCLSLKEQGDLRFDWPSISKVADNLNLNLDKDLLYNEFCDFRSAYPGLDKTKSEDQIWVDFFKRQTTIDVCHSQLLKLISYIFNSDQQLICRKNLQLNEEPVVRRKKSDVYGLSEERAANQSDLF